MCNQRSFLNRIVASLLPSLALVLGGCGPATSTPNSQTTDMDKLVKCEVLSIKPITGEKVKLMIKVTNQSKQHIVRAKALVTVLDAAGNEQGSKSTYVVHSAKGGLAPGASVEEDAFIDVTDKTKVVKASFKMEDVRTQ